MQKKGAGPVVYWNHFKVLMYKNYIIKRRNVRTTLLEILFPLYWIIILYITNLSKLQFVTNEVAAYPPAGLIPLSMCSVFSHSCIPFVYSPAIAEKQGLGPIVQAMMSENYLTPQQVKEFPSQADMVAYYHKYTQSITAGLVLDNTDLGSTLLNYDIYMNTTETSYLSFPQTTYMQLQQSFLQAVINVKNNNITRNVKLVMSTTQYPTPASLTKFNLNGILFSIYFPFLFIYSLQQVVVLVVTEKEKKVREAFRVMGMKDLAYWGSWYCTQTISNVIAIIVFCVAMNLSKLVFYTSIVMLFVSLILYSTGLILLGFIVSVFLEKPKTASAIAFLFLVGMIGLAQLGHYFFFTKIPVLKGLSYLFFVVPYSEIAFALADAEFNKTGLSFGDASNMLLLQFVDIIIMVLVIWYSSNVYAGEYGSAKPLYFPFLRKYWFPTPRDHPEMAPLLSHGGGSVNSFSGVVIEELHKKYKNEVVAVNGLSLRINQSEILALLGHNGAGKTTTLGILTGLVTPSSGNVSIMGYDISTDMDQIRNIIGYCPQHNVLLDQLTCLEHLRIFALLKGVSYQEVETVIEQKLFEVGLIDKRDTQSKELSGGMKRKLSVAIAFVGNSSLIFLDECTAGMDPYSRRQVWGLLQKYKAHKTIVMTTHFMEEAEVLGDRIAIMAKGKLRCLGTAMDLKNEFGVGYILRVVKQSPTNDMKGLDGLINDLFGVSAQVMAPSDLENIYQLPQQTTKFPEFFKYLDNNMQNLNIKSYGLSMTTLEEVFLKIASEDAAEEEKTKH